VLDLEHAAVILAHFGRFGPEYDELCKRLVEFIRGAACYGPAAATAARVVIKALQDVRPFAPPSLHPNRSANGADGCSALQAANLFMDGDVEEDQLLGLAKVLGSILVVSGPHFKILAKIDSTAFTNIHTSLLDWLIKLVAGHAEKGNKPKLRKSLALFKALPPLLAGAIGRDALAIHSHMAERLEAAGVAVTADKMWDHQRAYDKRVRPGSWEGCCDRPEADLWPRPFLALPQLTSLMAKDSKIAKGARKKVAEADEGSSPPPTSPTGAAKSAGKRKRPSAGADNAAGAEDDDDDDEAPAKAKKPRPKPKPRTSTRKSADRIEDSDAEAADTDGDASMAEDEEPAEEMLDMGGTSDGPYLLTYSLAGKKLIPAACLPLSTESSPEKAAADSEPRLPPSSPLSERSESAASLASVVVTKRKSLALKT